MTSVKQRFFQTPFFIAVWAAMSLYAGQACAEAGDRDKPIELEADSVTVNDAKKTSTYSGNVVLTQGTLVIKADKLIVREDNAGFQHSTSLGNPTTFRQKRTGKDEYMQGSAQRIEYDGRMDKVQLYTKAWVKRGEDIVYGDYIMYDANAEYAEAIGGGAQAATPNTPTGRVKAIIQPKKKTEEAKPAPQPGAAAPVIINKTLRFSRGLEVSGNDGKTP